MVTGDPPVKSGFGSTSPEGFKPQQSYSINNIGANADTAFLVSSAGNAAGSNFVGYNGYGYTTTTPYYYWWGNLDQYARDEIIRLKERVEKLEAEAGANREQVALDLLMSIDPAKNPKAFEHAVKAVRVLLGRE